MGPADVYEMMRHMDKDGDGLCTHATRAAPHSAAAVLSAFPRVGRCSFDEFRLAFGSAADTDVWAQELSPLPRREVDFSALRPIPIPELLELEQV